MGNQFQTFLCMSDRTGLPTSKSTSALLNTQEPHFMQPDEPVESRIDPWLDRGASYPPSGYLLGGPSVCSATLDITPFFFHSPIIFSNCAVIATSWRRHCRHSAASGARQHRWSSRDPTVAAFSRIRQVHTQRRSRPANRCTYAGTSSRFGRLHAGHFCRSAHCPGISRADAAVPAFAVKHSVCYV